MRRAREVGSHSYDAKDGMPSKCEKLRRPAKRLCGRCVYSHVSLALDKRRHGTTCNGTRIVSPDYDCYKGEVD